MNRSIFDSIIEVDKIIKLETPKNPLGAHEDRDQYEWIDCGDKDGGRIVPSLNSPFVSPYLYRGQVIRYSPCLPSIYRGFPLVKNTNELSEKQRDYYILAQIQLSEFLLSLEQHPAVKFASEIGLHLNRKALAQHYGIPTDYLDLTQDSEVAAFFASCAQNEKRQWVPIYDGLGVIYRFDVTACLSALGTNNEHKLFNILELIGLLTFPRPGEQKAWAIKLPLGFDFETLPLETFVFRHTTGGSNFFYNKFNGGKSLFPYDKLADSAFSIRNSTSLSSKLASKVILQFECQPNLLQDALFTYSKRFNHYFNISISNREPSKYSDKEICSLVKDFEKRKKIFLKKVFIRPVIKRK